VVSSWLSASSSSRRCFGPGLARACPGGHVVVCWANVDNRDRVVLLALPALHPRPVENMQLWDGPCPGSAFRPRRARSHAGRATAGGFGFRGPRNAARLKVSSPCCASPRCRDRFSKRSGNLPPAVPLADLTGLPAPSRSARCHGATHSAPFLIPDAAASCAPRRATGPNPPCHPPEVST